MPNCGQSLLEKFWVQSSQIHKPVVKVCRWYLCCIENPTRVSSLAISIQLNLTSSSMWKKQDLMDLCPGALVMSQHDGTFEIKVLRKPTHTDLYLQWDSNNTMSSKYSVISNPFHRAKAVCSNQQLLPQEQAHLEEVLQNANITFGHWIEWNSREAIGQFMWMTPVTKVIANRT